MVLANSNGTNREGISGVSEFLADRTSKHQSTTFCVDRSSDVDILGSHHFLKALRFILKHLKFETLGCFLRMGKVCASRTSRLQKWWHTNGVVSGPLAPQIIDLT